MSDRCKKCKIEKAVCPCNDKTKTPKERELLSLYHQAQYYFAKAESAQMKYRRLAQT